MLAALAAATLLVLPAQAQGNLTWTGTASATGVGVILGPRGGQPVFSLACVRGTSEMLAIAYGVKPFAGQQELTLSFGDKKFVFLVKPEAMKDGKMVQAASKARPALTGAIRAATTISGAYGTTKLGPWPAPPVELTKALVGRCEPLV
jgi:hypothetical protein